MEWPFEFWNLEELCRINKKLERLNTIGKCVYVILVSSLENGGATKPRRIEAFDTSRQNEIYQPQWKNQRTWLEMMLFL